MPEAIDPNRTVLRIDLRQYQWNARVWDRLTSVYPYYRKDSERAPAAATGAEVAAVRADWFVATASRPPLYHDFLQLPRTDRELERLLRVDVLTNTVANLDNYRPVAETSVHFGFNQDNLTKLVAA